jgi:chlorobactene glucosyltransferase
MTQNSLGGVSVIIPARNEESHIARAVKSVASQLGVREIIVVDDQSSDRTGEILEALRGEIPLLRVIRIEALPDGWAGKSHAAAAGAPAASGPWLLFTDADTEHLPGSLQALLARAERQGVDLLSVSPGQRVVAWWEKAVIPLIYVHLARLYSFEEVSDPESKAAAANGQYLLIRRETYQRVGGHEAVRGEILEDVQLARRVKAAGGKLLFLPGAEWVETRMYETFGALWEGWTKNLYLLWDGDLGRIFGTLAELILLDAALPVAFFALCFLLVWGYGSSAVALAAIGLFFAALWRQWNFGAALERLGFETRLANYLILGAGLFAALLVNSARAHRWKRSVRWKGRAVSTAAAGKDEK